MTSDWLRCIFVILLNIAKVSDRPTAIETKLGWVLSGPILDASQVDRQQSNLVTTHVLKSAVNPVDVTKGTLDGNLKNFGN